MKLKEQSPPRTVMTGLRNLITLREILFRRDDFGHRWIRWYYPELATNSSEISTNQWRNASGAQGPYGHRWHHRDVLEYLRKIEQSFEIIAKYLTPFYEDIAEYGWERNNLIEMSRDDHDILHRLIHDINDFSKNAEAHQNRIAGGWSQKFDLTSPTFPTGDVGNTSTSFLGRYSRGDPLLDPESLVGFAMETVANIVINQPEDLTTGIYNRKFTAKRKERASDVFHPDNLGRIYWASVHGDAPRQYKLVYKQIEEFGPRDLVLTPSGFNFVTHEINPSDIVMASILSRHPDEIGPHGPEGTPPITFLICIFTVIENELHQDTDELFDIERMVSGNQSAVTVMRQNLAIEPVTHEDQINVHPNANTEWKEMPHAQFPEFQVRRRAILSRTVSLRFFTNYDFGDGTNAEIIRQNVHNMWIDESWYYLNLRTLNEWLPPGSETPQRVSPQIAYSPVSSDDGSHSNRGSPTNGPSPTPISPDSIATPHGPERSPEYSPVSSNGSPVPPVFTPCSEAYSPGPNPMFPEEVTSPPVVPVPHNAADILQTATNSEDEDDDPEITAINPPSDNSTSDLVGCKSEQR